MVCSPRDVLQADKARSIQAVQQLFGILQDMLKISVHFISLLAAQDDKLCTKTDKCGMQKTMCGSPSTADASLLLWQ